MTTIERVRRMLDAMGMDPTIVAQSCTYSDGEHISGTVVIDAMGHIIDDNSQAGIHNYETFEAFEAAWMEGVE